MKSKSATAHSTSANRLSRNNFRSVHCLVPANAALRKDAAFVASGGHPCERSVFEQIPPPNCPIPERRAGSTNEKLDCGIGVAAKLRGISTSFFRRNFTASCPFQPIPPPPPRARRATIRERVVSVPPALSPKKIRRARIWAPPDTAPERRSPTRHEQGNPGNSPARRSALKTPRNFAGSVRMRPKNLFPLIITCQNPLHP
jgi:hypothetical protein